MRPSQIAFVLSVTLLLHTVCGHESGEHEIDFDSDLVSWPRLKRDAGYFTEGGVYLGGLWRVGRDTELEFYECESNTTNYCQSWTLIEQRSKRVQYGSCFCKDGTAFCGNWTCPHVEIGARCDSRGKCRFIVWNETNECTCDETNNKERYCTKWSCSESGTPGDGPEHEYYTCLEEDISGEYCFRWKGDISSSYEIESSVCECVHGTETYCQYWECKERGLIRCAAHKGGWCDLNIAIGVGGGCGLFFTLVGCVCASSHCDTRKRRLVCFLLVFLFGCVPWSPLVAIWGGIRGLVIVVVMWVFTWFVIGLSVAVKHRRELKARCHEARIVHPSP